MYFGLSEEQEALQGAVNQLLQRGGDGIWATLADQIGVAGLAVPEEYDGTGFTSFETHLVLEQLGYFLTTTPILGNYLAARALVATGTEEAKQRLLPRLAAGTAGAVVFDGPGSLVTDAPDAEIVLAIVNNQLLEVTDGDIRRTPALDQTWNLGHVEFDPARATTVGEISDDGAARLRSAGATAVTALQVGGAQAALDKTVAYLKQREQFGRALGSFQALKHRVADMLVHVETARSISWSAAWAAAQDADDLTEQAAMAKAWCSDAFSSVAAEMIQLHGGVAITLEHDAHLYFKRAHATAQLFGSPRAHRTALAAR